MRCGRLTDTEVLLEVLQEGRLLVVRHRAIKQHGLVV